MRRLGTPVALLVLLAVALLCAGPVGSASALPPQPWTGTWLDNNGVLLTLTQTGTQITGSQVCPGQTTLPGVTITGTASADDTTASFSYSSTVCPGVGGTFTATLAANGRRADGTGVTQFGTGFALTWTYQSGGNEPRETPPPAPARALCPGGPWAGTWTRTDGKAVWSIAQNGSQVAVTLVDGAETINGSASGNTMDGTYRLPGATGAVRFLLAADLASLRTEPKSPQGAPLPGTTFTFTRCAKGLEAVDLARTVPAPQTIQGGPTTIVAPGTVSITSLTRSKCVLVKVASARPARILVSIFSGRRSIRLFGQKRVVFEVPGKRRICIGVPFRAHTFNVRTRLNIALGYVVGARAKPRERKPKPVIRRIRLVP